MEQWIVRIIHDLFEELLRSPTVDKKKDNVRLGWCIVFSSILRHCWTTDRKEYE